MADYATTRQTDQLFRMGPSGASEFEPLLNTGEAAALLKIHPKTLQKMARNGAIAGIQVGKLWRFRVSQLNSWMDSRLLG